MQAELESASKDDLDALVGKIVQAELESVRHHMDEVIAFREGML